MKRRTLPLVLVFAAGLAFSSPARADEKVPLDQVPANVKATIQQHVQDGKLEEIERDKENGVTTYEVEYRTKEGTKYELRIAENGKLLTKKKD
jgi:uncharacterized membrane protein YkoI